MSKANKNISNIKQGSPAREFSEAPYFPHIMQCTQQSTKTTYISTRLSTPDKAACTRDIQQARRQTP